MSKSPEEIYKEKEKRFNDAVSLKQPDKVPIAFDPEFFMTKVQGLTHKEALYEPEKTVEAWKKTLKKFDWDMAPIPSKMLPGPVMELLDVNQYDWPGYNLDENRPFQFIEKEYMKEDEYDELLSNPGDFIIRKIWPRIANVFKPLANVDTPLHMISDCPALIGGGIGILSSPEMLEMLDTLKEAALEHKRIYGIYNKAKKELEEMGYPLLYNSITRAPFDLIADYFRGMRGITMDMFRQPDKLLAAIDYFTPFLIDKGVRMAKKSGCPRVFIPLHRGASDFMSNEYFAKFYWPSLKKVIVGLIEEDLTPCVIWEHDYNSRLEFLKELPKGKVAGRFEKVDLKKTKEILGDVMCFWGNIPGDTLIYGEPDEVKDYIRKLIDIFGDNGGLILNSTTVGIPTQAKPENVMAVNEAVEEYGIYK